MKVGKLGIGHYAKDTGQSIEKASECIRKASKSTKNIGQYKGCKQLYKWYMSKYWKSMPKYQESRLYPRYKLPC